MAKETSSREIILNKIKQALATPVPVPFPDANEMQEIFTNTGKEIEIEFAENFTSLQGRFSFCSNMGELVTQLKELLAARQWTKIFCSEDDLKSRLSANGFQFDYYNNLSLCEASVTSCVNLVARTGSIVLSSAAADGRTASIYAPIHICIAYTHQVVYDIKDVLQKFENNNNNLPSLLSFATGPSRTADIEKTLVTGVHGPKEVFCFLVEG